MLPDPLPSASVILIFLPCLMPVAADSTHTGTVPLPTITARHSTRRTPWPGPHVLDRKRLAHREGAVQLQGEPPGVVPLLQIQRTRPGAAGAALHADLVFAVILDQHHPANGAGLLAALGGGHLPGFRAA